MASQRSLLERTSGGRFYSGANPRALVFPLREDSFSPTEESGLFLRAQGVVMNPDPGWHRNAKPLPDHLSLTVAAIGLHQREPDGALESLTSLRRHASFR